MNPKLEAFKLIKKYSTNNPYEIAEHLNVVVISTPLGKIKGCYKVIRKRKVIFLNILLNEIEKIVVLAHELGHAVMHPYTNCNFMQNYTLLSTDKLEIEANKFCANILLLDSMLMEFEGFTYEQIGAATGIPVSIVKLRNL